MAQVSGTVSIEEYRGEIPPPPDPSSFWVYSGQVEAGRILFPLSMLIVEFLSFYDLHPLQLVPSAFRILAAVSALNRALGIDLGLNEVRSFYILKPLTGGGSTYHLARRPGTGTLILDAQDFIYDWRSKVLRVRGAWEMEKMRRLIEEEENERFRDFCAGFSTGFLARQDGVPFPSESRLKEMYQLSLFERKCGRFSERDPDSPVRSTPSSFPPGRQG
ncbi:hypothetical protein QJS10_CPB22g00180 [Acorus calamus]|uniref:Uncharacterized protein n=1 Tax=Acorus calamus TaxID=4465 RepID=A0AAV9C2E7_ACOCL|nr:hypothetical protein QJS10_CPB22g00180 [Acorus calamus]